MLRKSMSSSTIARGQRWDGQGLSVLEATVDLDAGRDTREQVCVKLLAENIRVGEGGIAARWSAVHVAWEA